MDQFMCVPLFPHMIVEVRLVNERIVVTCSSIIIYHNL